MSEEFDVSELNLHENRLEAPVRGSLLIGG